MQAADGPREASEGPPVHLTLTPDSKLNWSEITPGSTLELADGVYGNALVVRAVGTALAPIVIKAASGAKPVARNSLIFTSAAHVRVEGITIRDISKPGVIVKNGSHHVSLTDSEIRNTDLGIWITDGAGSANRFSGNIIKGSRTHGVAVNLVNAAPGEETVFAGNRVSNNGYHGFEIHGSHYIIEDNEVFANGAALPGTSGIHVFSRKLSENSGDYNVIRYNRSYGNIEHHGPDGNGIQLDHWCDNNAIYYNLVYENDGPGISIYDAAANRIQHNTVYANMRDPGRDHPYPGEIMLASDTESDADHVRDTKISGNIVFATRTGVRSLYVGPKVADNELDISGNLFFHASGEPVIYWAGMATSDHDQLDRVSGRRMKGNRNGSPMFLADEPKILNEFRLRGGSPAIAAGVPAGFSRDLAGRELPATGPLDLGALQFSGHE
jgi:parallel beta-helix repeat protein